MHSGTTGYRVPSHSIHSKTPEGRAMKLTLGLVAYALLMSAAGDKKQADAPLEGVWKVQTLVFKGNELEDAKGGTFTFKGKKMIRETPDGDDTYDCKLFPSKKPAEVDFVSDHGENKGKTLKAIYELKEGELKLCLSLDPDTKRPEGFAAKDTKGYLLITLKRERQ
jgi:uncharacterized protein (TIGR03067 family)